MGLCQFTRRRRPPGKALKDHAPRRITKRRETEVESGIKLSHTPKYSGEAEAVKILRKTPN